MREWCEYTRCPKQVGLAEFRGQYWHTTFWDQLFSPRLSWPVWSNRGHFWPVWVTLAAKFDYQLRFGTACIYIVLSYPLPRWSEGVTTRPSKVRVAMVYPIGHPVQVVTCLYFKHDFSRIFSFSAKPESLCLQYIHILQLVLSSFVTFAITVNSFLMKPHNSREQIWYLIIFSYLKVVRGIEKVGGVHCKLVNKDYLSSNKYLNASVVPISRSLFEGLLKLTLSGRILNTCAQHTLYMR